MCRCPLPSHPARRNEGLPLFLSFVEAWLLELGHSKSAAAVNHFATHGTFAAAPLAPPPEEYQESSQESGAGDVTHWTNEQGCLVG
jgi:hypothetical protein